MTIFAGDKERNLANTVMDWLLNLGYLGLFLGTFLAGTVLPLSSDILLVGMLAAKADPLICLPVAAVGNWLGAMTSYWLGWYAKWEWLEKWFRIKPDTLRRQQERVDKYGVWLAVVFWAPFIGMVCMIALGVYKGTPPDDGTPGAGRLLPPVFILDTAPDRLAAITRPAAGKPPHCPRPGTGRPSRRRKNGNFW